MFVTEHRVNTRKTDESEAVGRFSNLPVCLFPRILI